MCPLLVHTQVPETHGSVVVVAYSSTCTLSVTHSLITLASHTSIYQKTRRISFREISHLSWTPGIIELRLLNPASFMLSPNWGPQFPKDNRSCFFLKSLYIRKGYMELNYGYIAEKSSRNSEFTFFKQPSLMNILPGTSILGAAGPARDFCIANIFIKLSCCLMCWLICWATDSTCSYASENNQSGISGQQCGPDRYFHWICTLQG